MALCFLLFLADGWLSIKWIPTTQELSIRFRIYGQLCMQTMSVERVSNVWMPPRNDIVWTPPNLILQLFQQSSDMFSINLLLLMKHGCTIMDRRPNNSSCMGGGARVLHSWRDSRPNVSRKSHGHECWEIRKLF